MLAGYKFAAGSAALQFGLQLVLAVLVLAVLTEPEGKTLQLA